MKVFIQTMVAVFILTLLMTPISNAKIYRWVDEEGQLHISSQRPANVQHFEEYGGDVKKKEAGESNHDSYGLDLKVLDIKIKILERSGKYIEFSLGLKVKCSNPKYRGPAEVTLRALDRQGFELRTVSVDGYIGRDSCAFLTEKCFWPYRLYKQINKWEVTRIDF